MKKTKYLTIICSPDGSIRQIDNNQSLIRFSNNTQKIYSIVDNRAVLNFYKCLTNQNISTTFNTGNFKINTLNGIKKFRIRFINKNNFKILKLLQKNNLTITNDSIFDKIKLITRLKFVIGSLMPFIFSAVFSYNRYDSFNFLNFILAFISIILLHIAANMLNDYFDWTSGRDQININYIPLYTGGSRAIEVNLISKKLTFIVSIVSILLSIIISMYFVNQFGYRIILIGSIGIFCVIFYSAPPIHLASRKGLGELCHIICLGPLIVYGSNLILSGISNYIDLMLGLPFGLLITGCLIINEYPDSNFDELSGKKNLAVILKEKIKYLYILIFCLVLLCTCIIVFYFKCGQFFLIPMLTLSTLIDQKSKLLTLSNNYASKLHACEYAFSNYILYSTLYIISAFLPII